MKIYRRLPRRLAITLVVVLVLGFAYSPILRSGLLGSDYLALSTVRAPGEAWKAVLDAQGGALARFSLSVSRELYGVDAPGPFGFSPALFYRLEHIVILLIGVVGLALFVRRLLLPWVGSDSGRAAGSATSLLFLVHPLVPPAVAALSARGELVAFALAAWSGAAFLRGRQEHRFGFTVFACVLAVGAGFASDLALVLPWSLVGAELVSAHRYRPLRMRLRTATTTALVFGGAVMVEILVRSSQHGVEALPVGVVALRQGIHSRGAAALFSGAVEELGFLVLPSNPQVWGVTGTLLAGAVFLMAMQPALGAARSAPRLWGWILFGWFATLVATEVVHAESSVSPRSLDSVHRLLASVAVMAFGLGVGSTALSGRRRLALPLVCALGYAILAYGSGLPWIPASRALDVLRRDVAVARAEFGSDVRLLVVDPPLAIHGLDPIGGSLPLIVAEPEEHARGVAPDVQALPLPAFLAYCSQPEFVATLDGAVVALIPPGTLSLGPVVGQRRVARPVSRPGPSGSVRTWRGDPRSPALDVEALAIEACSVRLPGELPKPTAIRLSWRAADATTYAGLVAGAWSRVGEEWLGVFDLRGSLAWRLSGRVRLIWLEGEVFTVNEASLLERLPSVGAAGPSTTRDDWVFDAPEHSAAGDVDVSFVLTLLNLKDLDFREFPVLRRATGQLSINDFVPTVEAWLENGGPLVWGLELRLDGLVVARDGGRWSPGHSN